MVINILTNLEYDRFMKFCKEYEITINQSHKKDDYEIEKYLKPSTEILQEILKKSTSPKKTDSPSNKNTEDYYQYENQQTQSSIKR